MLCEDGGDELAAGAEECVLSSLIVGEGPGQAAYHEALVDGRDDGGGVDIHLDGAVHNQLEALSHVSAGKLIVVVNGDGDRTAGLLFNVLLKEVCADAVVCGSDWPLQDRSMLILSYLPLSAPPPLLVSLPQAHSAKTMHRARTIDRNLFISFSPLLVYFFYFTGRAC